MYKTLKLFLFIYLLSLSCLPASAATLCTVAMTSPSDKSIDVNTSSQLETSIQHLKNMEADLRTFAHEIAEKEGAAMLSLKEADQIRQTIIGLEQVLKGFKRRSVETNKSEDLSPEEKSFFNEIYFSKD